MISILNKIKRLVSWSNSCANFHKKGVNMTLGHNYLNPQLLLCKPKYSQNTSPNFIIV